MKVLHVVGSLDPKLGGTAEAVLQLAHAMLSMEVSSDILTLDAADNAAARKAAANFPVHLKGSTRRSTYAYSRALPEWLTAHVHHYDAVIIHGLWQYHSFAASRVCRKAQVPYFVFPHGMLDPWFNRTYPLKKLKKLLYWYWGENPVLRHARAVLFTTEEECRLARESFPAYRVHEKVVGLGTRAPEIDMQAVLADFRKEALPWARRPYLLFMSRIQEKKGLDLLVAAYSELRATSADFPDLVIAGPIEQPDYAKHIQTNYSQQGIHWIGSLNAVEKWPALIAAEAMLLVSHQENFGLVIAESLAVGTPVLISNKINIWREVLAGGAGFVAEDSVSGARQLLEQWMALSCSAKAKMASAARPCFERYFEIKQSTVRLVDFIRSHI